MSTGGVLGTPLCSLAAGRPRDVCIKTRGDVIDHQYAISLDTHLHTPRVGGGRDACGIHDHSILRRCIGRAIGSSRL